MFCFITECIVVLLKINISVSILQHYPVKLIIKIPASIIIADSECFSNFFSLKHIEPNTIPNNRLDLFTAIM